MRKEIYILGAIIIYFILINFLSSIDFSSYFIENYSQEYVQAGTAFSGQFSDSVSISVLRKRFYGTITEQGQVSTLYLFNLFKIPLKDANFNYKYFHIIFAILLILFYGYSRLKNKKNLKIPENIPPNVPDQYF